VQALGQALLDKAHVAPSFRLSRDDENHGLRISPRSAAVSDIRQARELDSPMSVDVHLSNGPTEVLAPRRLGWGGSSVATSAGLMQVVWNVIISEAYHASAPLSHAANASKASNGRVFEPSFLQGCNDQLEQVRIALQSGVSDAMCTGGAYLSAAVGRQTLTLASSARWSASFLHCGGPLRTALVFSIDWPSVLCSYGMPFDSPRRLQTV
jgi:hypothetical protein